MNYNSTKEESIIEKHRKSILIGSTIISVVCLVSGIMILTLPQRTNKQTSFTNTELLKEISVPSFIRKLPKGHHASMSKVNKAAALGIDLQDGKYTIVDSFTYIKRAA